MNPLDYCKENHGVLKARMSLTREELDVIIKALEERAERWQENTPEWRWCKRLAGELDTEWSYRTELYFNAKAGLDESLKMTGGREW